MSFSVRPVSFPFARSPFPARSGLFVLSLWNGQSGRGVFAPLSLPLFWSALHECAPYGGAAFDRAPSPIARVRLGPVTSCHNASQPRHALVTPIDTFSTVPEHRTAYSDISSRTPARACRCVCYCICSFLSYLVLRCICRVLLVADFGVCFCLSLCFPPSLSWCLSISVPLCLLLIPQAFCCLFVVLLLPLLSLFGMRCSMFISSPCSRARLQVHAVLCSNGALSAAAHVTLSAD